MAVPDVYRALWRRKLMIVVLTAAIVAGAWYLTSRQQRIYTASTLVRVQQRVQNSGEALLALETGGRLAQTYAHIAASDAIATRIYTALGRTVPWNEIAGHISGAQVQDLELLRISVQSPDPKRAQLIANTAPGALEGFIRGTATLRDHVTVIDSASVPASPSSPNTRMMLLLALMVALALNGTLAVLLESLRDRVGSGDELEGIVGRPVLAILPELPLDRGEDLGALHEEGRRSGRVTKAPGEALDPKAAGG